MPIKNDEGLITLTSDDVLDFALDTLLKGVKLYINGRKCTAENVWEIILKASAGHTAVNDVCDDLVGAPNGNTVLGKVHAALPQALNQLWRLEAQLNRVLLLNVPARLLVGKLDSLWTLGGVLGACVVCQVLSEVMWRVSLRHYTSASS